MVAAPSDVRVALAGLILRFSLLISLLAGNSVAETGSTRTASATTHSRANGDFLALTISPRIGGVVWLRFVSAEDHLFLAAVSSLLSLSAKSRFPETETQVRRDPVRTHASIKFQGE
jgi:hypothetical protein